MPRDDDSWTGLGVLAGLGIGLGYGHSKLSRVYGANYLQNQVREAVHQPARAKRQSTVTTAEFGTSIDEDFYRANLKGRFASDLSTDVGRIASIANTPEVRDVLVEVLSKSSSMPLSEIETAVDTALSQQPSLRGPELASLIDRYRGDRGFREFYSRISEEGLAERASLLELERSGPKLADILKGTASTDLIGGTTLDVIRNQFPAANDMIARINAFRAKAAAQSGIGVNYFGFAIRDGTPMAQLSINATQRLGGRGHMLLNVPLVHTGETYRGAQMQTRYTSKGAIRVGAALPAGATKPEVVAYEQVLLEALSQDKNGLESVLRHAADQNIPLYQAMTEYEQMHGGAKANVWTPDLSQSQGVFRQGGNALRRLRDAQSVIQWGLQNPDQPWNQVDERGMPLNGALGKYATDQQAEAAANALAKTMTDARDRPYTPAGLSVAAAANFQSVSQNFLDAMYRFHSRLSGLANRDEYLMDLNLGTRHDRIIKDVIARESNRGVSLYTQEWFDRLVDKRGGVVAGLSPEFNEVINKDYVPMRQVLTLYVDDAGEGSQRALRALVEPGHNYSNEVAAIMRRFGHHMEDGKNIIDSRVIQEQGTTYRQKDILVSAESRAGEKNVWTEWQKHNDVSKPLDLLGQKKVFIGRSAETGRRIFLNASRNRQYFIGAPPKLSEDGKSYEVKLITRVRGRGGDRIFGQGSLGVVESQRFSVEDLQLFSRAVGRIGRNISAIMPHRQLLKSEAFVAASHLHTIGALRASYGMTWDPTALIDQLQGGKGFSAEILARAVQSRLITPNEAGMMAGAWAEKGKNFALLESKLRAVGITDEAIIGDVLTATKNARGIMLGVNTFMFTGAGAQDATTNARPRIEARAIDTLLNARGEEGRAIARVLFNQLDFRNDRESFGQIGTSVRSLLGEPIDIDMARVPSVALADVGTILSKGTPVPEHGFVVRIANAQSYMPNSQLPAGQGMDIFIPGAKHLEGMNDFLLDPESGRTIPRALKDALITDFNALRRSVAEYDTIAKNQLISPEDRTRALQDAQRKIEIVYGSIKNHMTRTMVQMGAGERHILGSSGPEASTTNILLSQRTFTALNQARAMADARPAGYFARKVFNARHSMLTKALGDVGVRRTSIPQVRAKLERIVETGGGDRAILEALYGATDGQKFLRLANQAQVRKLSAKEQKWYKNYSKVRSWVSGSQRRGKHLAGDYRRTLTEQAMAGGDLSVESTRMEAALAAAIDETGRLDRSVSGLRGSDRAIRLRETRQAAATIGRSFIPFKEDAAQARGEYGFDFSSLSPVEQQEVMQTRLISDKVFDKMFRQLKREAQALPEAERTAQLEWLEGMKERFQRNEAVTGVLSRSPEHQPLARQFTWLRRAAPEMLEALGYDANTMIALSNRVRVPMKYDYVDPATGQRVSKTTMFDLSASMSIRGDGDGDVDALVLNGKREHEDAARRFLTDKETLKQRHEFMRSEMFIREMMAGEGAEVRATLYDYLEASRSKISLASKLAPQADYAANAIRISAWTSAATTEADLPYRRAAAILADVVAQGGIRETKGRGFGDFNVQQFNEALKSGTKGETLTQLKNFIGKNLDADINLDYTFEGIRHTETVKIFTTSILERLNEDLHTGQNITEFKQLLDQIGKGGHDKPLTSEQMRTLVERIFLKRTGGAMMDTMLPASGREYGPSISEVDVKAGAIEKLLSPHGAVGKLGMYAIGGMALAGLATGLLQGPIGGTMEPPDGQSLGMAKRYGYGEKVDPVQILKGIPEAFSLGPVTPTVYLENGSPPPPSISARASMEDPARLQEALAYASSFDGDSNIRVHDDMRAPFTAQKFSDLLEWN